MGFWQAIQTAIFKKYAKFSRRASRSEFWWFMLFYVLCYILIFAVQSVVLLARIASTDLLDFIFFIIDNLFLLMLLLPRVGVTVRRLHDLNFSGWWSLIFVGLAITTWIPILNAFFTLDFLRFYKITDIVNIYKVGFSLLAFILLIVLIRKGDKGLNKYGECPVRTNVDVSVFS